jgi:hypothetical protein
MIFTYHAKDAACWLQENEAAGIELRELAAEQRLLTVGRV